MEGVIVMISLFILVFGLSYMYFTTRHKERLTLIEKGVDASIFFSPKAPRSTPVLKLLTLNLALISMGIGLGVIMGSFLSELTVMGDAAYPACIFFTGGLGLLIGYHQSKNMN